MIEIVINGSEQIKGSTILGIKVRQDQKST
jgi:hypothetical protein